MSKNSNVFNIIMITDIAAVVQHIGRPFVRVAIDGSLYKKHPKLHRLITDFIHELIPDHKVELFSADEGSSKGSALIAAVAVKHRQQLSS